MATGNEKLLIDGRPVSSVAFSADGQLIAAGDVAGRVAIWDAATGNPAGSFQVQDRMSVNGIVFFSGPEVIATGDAGGGVALWLPSSGKMLAVAQVSGAGVNGLASQGRVLAAVSEGGAVQLFGVTLPATTVSLAASVRGMPGINNAENFVRSYFTAINNHDYSAYKSLLAPQVAANESPSNFMAGFSSVVDSDIVITNVSALQPGAVAVTVSFTSHQNPAQSIDGSTCDSWQITLYLVQGNGGYVEVPPPSGYYSSHQAC
jgi:hypothetical protein